MAASSMKDIKLRIKSVESTMQITKAMELVASSKVRKAKLHAERTRPYFTTLYETLSDIAENNREFSSVYVQDRPVSKTCYVIIAGDRGLAGGYNANLFRAMEEHRAGRDCVALPIGKKAVEYCQHNQIPILTQAYDLVEKVSLGDCSAMAELLCKAFRNHEFDELNMAYTNFVSMLSQQPAVMKLLPLHYERQTPAPQGPGALTLFEPSSTAVFNAIVPEYVTGLLYGALAESEASEQSARRAAMDAASKNAGEMIETLSLHYNRARQAAITQEITEIVAGAEN
ncbi:MAG: ATP synthase F1 subunit gamma [Oscillospiraceae bacterium]|nr:ATP synthase F1 subunit gamma [Oscillospiraceae bacterium]